VPFPFYVHLSPRGKAIYNRSDELDAAPLPRPLEARALLTAIETTLAGEDRLQVLTAAAGFISNLTEQLGVPPVRVRVLSVRPSSKTAELHGLYERESGETATIRVWMRTAVHKRCVSFRTFARTLLHELGHHLDYELYRLLDSYHTQGFFRREAAMFRQITGERPRRRAPAAAGKKAEAGKKRPAGKKQAPDKKTASGKKPARARKAPARGKTTPPRIEPPVRERIPAVVTPPPEPTPPEPTPQPIASQPARAPETPTRPEPGHAPVAQPGLPFD